MSPKLTELTWEQTKEQLAWIEEGCLCLGSWCLTV
jgi:hypothetical protein